MSEVRYIALHLPQFHPIPENDAWWGPGFTEWTNVVKARPRFPGHEQPHLPADLGFYDLRLPEARAAQARLAARNGVDAFCYYHYWFEGRRLLERPVDEILASGQPDFPFCLCWANESWSRRWDGSEREVLLRQGYSEADDEAHAAWLLRAFADPRYLCVDGKPLFLLYRAGDVTTLPHLVAALRRRAAEAGLPGLFLVSVRNSWNEGFDPRAHGLDASLKFQPFWRHVDEAASRGPGGAGLRAGLGRLLRERSPRLFAAAERLRAALPQQDRVVPYDAVAAAALAAAPPPFLEFPCVTPRWDNSPRRRSGATILQGSTPAAFGRWLQAATEQARALPEGRRLVFLNAWNEWAEGAHLEPDDRHGTAYLEEVARVRAGRPRSP